MKGFLGIVVSILAVSTTHAQINSVEEITIHGYHRKIGIPQAARIKRLEEETLISGNLSRIVGGSITDISQVPYQAGLIMAFAEGNSICGGSLISNTRVVTAAHCHSESDLVAQSFTVVLGSNFIFFGGVRITTTNVAVHPNWDPWNTVNDVAVLRISPVSFSNVIQPINLPSGTDILDNFAGDTGLASGFGYTAEDSGITSNQRLMSVNLLILRHDDCAPIFGQWYHPTNICANGASGQSTCHGDSGGPVAVRRNGRRILVGITSYRHWSGCTSGYPAVQTRVTSFVNWIASQ